MYFIRDNFSKWLFVLISIFFGFYMIKEGIDRGSLYKNVNQKDIKYMTVTELSKNQIFHDLEAIGYIDNPHDKLSVKIFLNDYKVLSSNHKKGIYPKLEVLLINKNNTNQKYVFVDKYKESIPIINLFGLYLSWHFISGLVIFIIGIFVSMKPITKLV